MALISPCNLLTLHSTSGIQTRSLLQKPSGRYSHSTYAPAIPSSALFEGLSEKDPGANALPTVAQCAVHLEMLEAFHTLQQEVIHSQELDEAFDIQPTTRTVYRKRSDGKKYISYSATLKDTTFARRRKAKWDYFMSIAVVRFHDWIRIVNGHLKDYENGGDLPKYLLLPPLDILMIWHAFLLNCDDFKDYCTRRKLTHVQNIVFPWPDIHDAINPDTWSYTLPADHGDWLRETGYIDPNLIDALATAGRTKGTTTSDLLAAFADQTLRNNKGDISDPPLTGLIRAAHAGKEYNKPLVQNVERQIIFVDKMHAHRWLRSPAVEGTLRRTVDRYDKFLHLFRLYPDNFLVPTLDVDLAWHTHQCSASNYREFVTERVGRFINHDDKIGRGTLDDGFTSAEQWYRFTYGEQYQVCLCWSCEAILSAVEDLGEDVLDDVQPSVADLAQRVERKVHYYRELETGRRLGREIPIWNHAYD